MTALSTDRDGMLFYLFAPILLFGALMLASIFESRLLREPPSASGSRRPQP